MRFKPAQVKLLEADLTPLIDLTFLLITFFMLVINFAKAELDDSVQLPESEIAQPPEDSEESAITLQLTADNQVIMKGQQFPFGELQRRLESEARFYTEFFEQSPSETDVIIRADRRSQGGYVRRMIDTCQDVGFSKFVLRAKQSAGGGSLDVSVSQ
ncbi:MAG: biopolymer transporter ExbD [Pirellulales bacterium]|nr:biopolymer transporter ExbD [Pirellulales bacterium]